MSDRLEGVGLHLVRLIRDFNNTIVGATVRLTLSGEDGTKAKDVDVPADLARAGKPTESWFKHTGISFDSSRARVATRWLSRALVVLDAPSTTRAVKATWIGDRLHLP